MTGAVMLHPRPCRGAWNTATVALSLALSLALHLAGAVRCFFGVVVAAALLDGTQAATAPVHGTKSCPGFEHQITIEGGTEADHAAACEGFTRAVGFFARFGYQTQLPVTIVFVDSVVLPVKGAAGQETFVGGTRVVGMFEAATQRVTMTSLTAPWLRKRPYFNLPYDRELLVSVLAHESAHALSKAFYSYPTSPGMHAQEEYIAYAAQLATMAPGKLQQVLAGYAAARWTFSSKAGINDLVHAAVPHGFGVMSYRHFMGPQGGRAFLERIYSGEFKPIDLSDLL